METDEPFKLPIDTVTTVEEDTVSCDTTTASKSVSLPPQQDPETEIIAGRDLMETGEHLNLPIDIVTTLEEEDSVSSDITTTSPPHQATETTHSSDVTTANETTDAEIVGAPTVRGKKPKRVYRIKAPTYCECHKEIKGKCAPCQIRELKRLVQEKDKQLIVRSYQVKATVDLEKLKCKLKEKDKKLNASSKQLARMCLRW
jgi:hypothetical protein